MAETKDMLDKILRQDFVDNSIYELLETVGGSDFYNPVNLEWNLEHIGRVRDVVEEIIVHVLQLMSEEEFYPVLKEEK
jgi:hypothetical protein